MLLNRFDSGSEVQRAGEALTVWLFNMNWTALSFTSFLTLLYVHWHEVKEKTLIQEPI